MDKRDITHFQKIVWDFYASSGRVLPWRKTKDPYRILVSEVMLQQTQVPRVLVKYAEFLKAFPTLHNLAQAPTSRVLSVWQGMGYNRRALALKRLAETVVIDFKGKIPKDRKILEALPGIGPYTAGAVRAFAWNEPEVFIETNIRRVFIHHFFEDQEGIHDNDIRPMVSLALDQENPREWYWALMDYGSTLAKEVENPNKRSKHYVRQKPFKGSRREVRGKILKLLGERKMGLSNLADAIGAPKEKVLEIINELSREGFIIKKGTSYALKD